MKVLITGATGFLGSCITRKMAQRGFDVLILTREESDLGRVSDVADRLNVLRADLKKPNSYIDRLSSFAPQIIVHSGWSTVERSRRDDTTHFENVDVSASLAEAAIECGVQHFIGLGSQAEYGVQNEPISEETPVSPITAYGKAKVATYRELERIAGSSGLCFTWLRLFSAYGPGDRADSLIAYLISTLLNREIPVLQSGDKLWDYLYVDDVADAITRIAQKRTSGLFNLAFGESLSLREVAGLIRDLIDPSLAIEEHANRTDPALYGLCADTSKLAVANGWTPTIPLADGLRRTISWHSSMMTRRIDKVERPAVTLQTNWR